MTNKLSAEQTAEEYMKANDGIWLDLKQAFLAGHAAACKSHEGTAEYRLGFERGKAEALQSERERILFEFEHDHQVEYELDVSPLNIRDFFTGNEWVTLQLIVMGKRSSLPTAPKEGE